MGGSTWLKNHNKRRFHPAELSKADSMQLHTVYAVVGVSHQQPNEVALQLFQKLLSDRICQYRPIFIQRLYFVWIENEKRSLVRSFRSGLESFFLLWHSLTCSGYSFSRTGSSHRGFHLFGEGDYTIPPLLAFLPTIQDLSRFINMYRLSH